MASMSSMQNRHGMVYLENDDSSSGEGSAETEFQHPPHPAVMSTHPYVEHISSRSSSRGGESEASYEDVYSSSEDSYHSDCDDIAEYWDPYLYQLQLKAPQPNVIPCLKRVQSDRPPFYGPEYHGSITREETARLLGERDGNYLVRKGLSQSGTFSLSFVFEKQVRHYKLYFEDGYHYVGEKPFDTVEDLVQDGLITLYMEANNVEDYLQSARQTRLVHQPSFDSSKGDLTTVQEGHTHMGEEPVFNEEELGVQLGGLSVHEPRQRRPVYQPCTIPQQRDRTKVQGEELAEEEVKPLPTKISLEDTTTAKDRKRSTMHYQYEKPHNFKLQSYIGMMAWCDYCRNFMWGLRNQGFKCKDCGYNVHKQCKDETGQDCQPSHQLIKRVYGVELTTLVKMEGTKIPGVIKDCITEVENRGMDTEGIYRMSGKKNEVLRVKNKFDTDMSADLSKFEDIHALTGAMKLYLRELPIPLVTFDVYDLCLIAVRMSSLQESLDMLKVALSRLPPPHYNTLRHLMRHLHEVQLFKNQNKMDCKNLGVVFTPSLMRCPHIAANGLMAVQKLPEEKKAVELLIQHYKTLFT